MKNVILSRNVFILVAFQEILTECNCKNTCIVDIDSYHSLHEILQVMMSLNLKQDHKLFFLKGNSVISKILVSITGLHILDSLSRLREVILTGRAPNYAFVVKYILSYKKLSMMTHKEKQIAQDLVKYRDIPSMASAVNTNRKTIYSRLRVMTIKLKLRDIAQVRQFIFAEMLAVNKTQ